eukprot:gene595-641_t
MQLLFVALLASFLVAAQANIAFYFVNGFQTKNTAESYYLTFSATTDKGATVSLNSNAITFDSKYNFTVGNADQYVTNIKASLISYSSKQTVATFTSDTTTKFFSNNFFIIAYTASYDPLTGTNTPKLSAVSGDTTSPYSITIAASYFFYSTVTTYGYLSGPSSYPVYYYPYNNQASTIYPYDSNYQLSIGQTLKSTATITNSLTYVNGSAATNTFKFTSSGIFTSSNSAVYAGTGQLFAAIYYGNYVYSQTGRIAFITPPNTLEVK